MDVNKLTIGEAKELAKFFCGKKQEAQPQSQSLSSRYEGQYVIVRSHNEGINAGYVIEADETGIILKDARRIWYHRPSDKNTAWYEGVAMSGLSNDSKISTPVVEKAIIEKYSVTLCTEKARLSIIDHKSHAQN